MTTLSECLADSPALFWKLDETSGTNADDASSGSPRDGTYTGTYTLNEPTLVADALGGSVRFNGSSGNYVRWPSGTGTPNTTAVTVEIWLKPNTLRSGSPNGVLQLGSSNDGRIGIRVSDSGRPSGRVQLLCDGTVFETSSSGSAHAHDIATGSVWHIVGTWDTSTNEVRLYLNGALIASGTKSGGGTINETWFTVPWNFSDGRQLDGWVQYVGVYPTVLSAARVLAHYQAAIGPPVSLAATLDVDVQLPAATLTTRLGAAITLDVGLTVTGGLATLLETWDLEESQKLSVDIDVDATLQLIPAPVAAPTGQSFAYLNVVSESFAALPTIADGKPTWGTATLARSVWGRPQVVINGADRTFVRGVPTVIGELAYTDPGGDAATTLRFPAVTGFEDYSDGDTSWLVDRPAFNVEIWCIQEDGTRRADPIFEGMITDYADTDDGLVVDVVGALRQAEFQAAMPSLHTEAADVGSHVPTFLNRGVPGRRYAWTPYWTTGIDTRERAALGDSVLAHVTDVLADATAASGSTITGQWTLRKQPGGGRRYKLFLRGAGAISGQSVATWTVWYGRPGVKFDPRHEKSGTPNVIYGHGTDPLTGCAWANWRVPRWHPDTAPAYPFTNPAHFISVGAKDTDAETDSGTGVSDFQRRMEWLGYAVTVTGVYSSADAAEVERVQKARGLTVNGQVNGQTWSAVFDLGANSGDLRGAYIAPLAWDPRVEPVLRNADGSYAGRNPAYDPKVLRVASEVVAFGNVDKATAMREAERRVQKSLELDRQGTLTLTVDPEGGSRFEIRPCDTIELRGYRGGDTYLTVAEVRMTLGGEVVLEVDTLFRDARTLDQIRQRNEAAKTPSRRPGSLQHAAKKSPDPVGGFDCETGAGRVPRMALTAGLWSVIRVLGSFSGRFTKVNFQTSAPYTKFAVALFGKNVSPAFLHSKVGNPLVNPPPNGDGVILGPFDVNGVILDDAGLISAWGMPGQAAGYHGRDAGTPGHGSEEQGSTVTGRLLDVGGVEYISAQPPWIWVAFYAPVSCFVEGRLYAEAVIQ